MQQTDGLGADGETNLGGEDAPFLVKIQFTEEQVRASGQNVPIGPRGVLPPKQLWSERQEILQVVEAVLAAADGVAGSNPLDLEETHDARIKCDFAIGKALAANLPAASDEAKFVDGDDVLAIGHAASLIRHVVSLLAEQSADGRAELARLGREAFSASLSEKRVMLVKTIEDAIQSLYGLTSDQRADVRTRTQIVSPMALSQPSEEEFALAADTILQTEWDIPGLMEVPKATVVELLRRCDSASPRPIKAAYVAAAVCIHAGVLDHRREDGEEFEAAVRRQSNVFRLAVGAQAAGQGRPRRS